jgi:hypothetical protein
VKAIIAPGIGEGAVWMISSQTLPWLGADVPMKTIWLIDATISGSVKLTGERTDGSGVATFVSVEDIEDHENAGPGADEATVAGVNARNRERLLRDRVPERVIEPPHDLRTDRRGYIFYPGPGCWRFTAATDQGTYQIVQYVSPQIP